MSSRTPLNPLGLSGGGGTAGAMSGVDARSDPLAAAEGLLGKYSTARPATAMRPGTAMGARPGTAARARPGSARGGRPPVSPRAEVMTLDTSSVAEDSHNLDESAEISYGDGFDIDRSDADASRSVEADAAAMDDSDDAAFYDNDDGGGAEVTTFSDGAEGIVLDDDSLGDSVSIDFDASARSPSTPATRPKSAPRRDVDLSMSVDDDALGDASISVDADDFANRRPAPNRPASAKGRPRGAPPPPAVSPPPPAVSPWAGALSDGEDDGVDDDVDDDVEMVDESGFSFSPSPRSPAAAEAEDETEALHRQLAGNDPMTQLRAFERDEGLSPSANGGPSPRSPAATEAADETEALHRMLAGNDPVSSLRAQFSPPEETRRPTSPPRVMRRATDPDESAEEVADESAAALEVLDESAEEIATEPRTSVSRYSEHLADYSETFESPDASRVIEGADDASAPRDADGSKQDGSRRPELVRSGDLGDKARALLEDIRALRSGDLGAGGPASAKDAAELARLLREVQRATRRRMIGVSRRAAAASPPVNYFEPAKKDYLGAFANLRRQTTSIRQTAEDGPPQPQKSYATTREEWSAYLAGEGGYPAGAPRPLGLDHDEKSFQEIWNASRLRTKSAASGAANDAAEDTSTSRAIAAAIRAHGACGHLRARVASIQMRLRDRKRELERAHPFG